MSWNTKITKLLNIDYPIIQGAMAYISDGVLAAAMSHAGCAGVIGSGGFTPDEVQSHIRRFKDIAGSQKVYGVNLMLQDDNKDDIAQIICDEKVPFVTIGAGNPIPWKTDAHGAFRERSAGYRNSCDCRRRYCRRTGYRRIASYGRIRSPDGYTFPLG